jgi:hypothetical protein
MNKAWNTFFITLLVTIQVLSFSRLSVADSAKMTAQEIVEKASLSSYYGGEDGRSAARMIIVDANGRKQIRQFTLLRKNVADGGKQKFLVVFSRPTDIKGTVFMVHKDPQGEDDRWLYLPALDLVKRISAGDNRTSFVGAHYFYEDVSGRSTSEDEHKIVAETDEVYILKHTPIKPETVEFSSYKTWIDKNNFLPKKIEYFNAKGEMTRLVETLEVEDVQGIATVTQSKVTNLIDGSHTLMEFRKMIYNIGLPDDLFTERALRNPPTKWLQSK